VESMQKSPTHLLHYAIISHNNNAAWLK